jgi:hypothetical protein
LTKKQISADESIKKFRELLSYIEDEDELQLPLAKWLNKGNWEKIDKFLETNEIDGSYFYSIAGIFFALSVTNPNEEHVHNIEKFKNNILKTEFYERLTTLLKLENNAYLMNQLKVDKKKIEQLKNFCKIMVEGDNRRYNYKSYLFEKLKSFFSFSQRCGLKRIDQIEIVYKILKEENFEDYGFDDYVGEKKERLAKIRDKRIRKDKRIYGKLDP